MLVVPHHNASQVNESMNSIHMTQLQRSRENSRGSSHSRTRSCLKTKKSSLESLTKQNSRQPPSPRFMENPVTHIQTIDCMSTGPTTKPLMETNRLLSPARTMDTRDHYSTQLNSPARSHFAKENHVPHSPQHEFGLPYSKQTTEKILAPHSYYDKGPTAEFRQLMRPSQQIEDVLSKEEIYKL